ncbi:MAG TPA: pyridoxamine 5'-phosphate oxidase family protein [Candidatus Limnocylindrales bacterium]|nr:pyridoxamine 5'-phosphate oxidase family protein [Candidatus Limnocylindrales bacterium]
MTGVHVPEHRAPEASRAPSGVPWDAFAASAPDLAGAGLALLDRTGSGRGLLATVREDAPPRINPVSLRVVDGRLLVFVIIGSAKDRDLLEDGRYALHAQWDPAVPHEFLVRGHVREVDDGAIRDAAISVWPFEADDSYRLFELLVESALLGERASDEVWPPVYRSWRAPASG